METLTAETAARLYRAGLSVCEIRERYSRFTAHGVVGKLRDAGVGGLSWCRIHRAYERVGIDPESGYDSHHLGRVSPEAGSAPQAPQK